MELFRQPTDMDRRTFIKGVGFVSLSFLFSTMFGGCERLFEKIKNRPVRRRLRTGSPEVDAVIEIYKDAVSKMKMKPASDPRSWAAQAGLHGTVSGGFNFCKHGTDHFFSWHRAYLLYFERICQELTGEEDFALPYWNWNQNPAIHPAFTDPDSPLFHPRNNTSVAGNPAFSNSTLSGILGDGNFYTFSSQLEGTPHNTAHVVVGGDMVTGGSPRDPVFWAHHCMVDYCWAKWNIELDNDNTNDPAWINTSWDHFVDGNGDPVTVSAGITPLMPLLSYRYETSAVGSFGAVMNLTALSKEALKKIEDRLRRGTEVEFQVRRRVTISRGADLTIARPHTARIPVSAQDFSALIEADRSEERVFLSIDYAQAPPVNDFFVRVFVNLPAATARTRTDDIHYAGSFAFFGTHMANADRHQHKTDFLVNVTDTLQRLKREDQLRSGEPLSVQLVAVPANEEFLRPDATLRLRGIDFVVSPVTIRAKEPVPQG